MCVRTCGSVHSPCRGVDPVFRIAYGWDADEVRARVPPDPRDRLELRQTEPVASVVPRFGLTVQSEVAARTPTPWTSPSAPSAKRPAAGATASSRSVRRATVGHAYCAVRCRTLARRRSVQAAKARHQRSREGRLDHRDHQRAYRARCRVRDHSSPAVSRYARLHAPDAPPAPAPDPTRCLVCGRVSRWLIPVRWPRVNRRRSDDHARAARRDPAPLFRRALEGRDHRGRPRRPP